MQAIDPEGPNWCADDGRDLAALRADTPGCAQVLHFNNAGAALMPAPVIAAVGQHLGLEARIGGYEAAAKNRDALEHTYTALARLINADSDEIAVIENATRAWDMAFYAFARDFKPGDRILCAEAEYVSNYLAFLQVADRTGCSVDTVPSDEAGALDVAALESMIDARVKLIAITHVPTNGGLVNPAQTVGRIANAAGIPFLVDACQSVGQMPIDVQAIGCDALSATGRKYLRGPRGTGFLYVRRAVIDTLEPPFVDLHAATWTARDRFTLRADARRFENWEGNVAGKIGLGVAADYALAVGVEAGYRRLRALAETLRSALADIPGVTVRDVGHERCGIVTFSHAGRSADAIKAGLASQAINVSVSPRDYALIDSEARNLPDLVRASVHYYNTEAEVHGFADAVTAFCRD